MQYTEKLELEECTIDASFHQKDREGLLITYTFRNRSPKRAYLFNRLYDYVDEDAVFHTDPHLVYVEVERQKLVLGKKIVAVPPNTLVEKRIVPCLTVVPPGGEFKESFTIPLPLRPYNPYVSIAEETLPLSTVDCEAWFELGFFLGAYTSDDFAKRVRTREGEALYFGSFPIGSQRIMRVGPLSWKVPARVSSSG